MAMRDTPFLFVYGSLRPGGDAAWRLTGHADHVGAARLTGAALYHVADYPGMVLTGDPADIVHGDVFNMHDPIMTLALIDTYEECTADFPQPYEYDRVQHRVQMTQGPVMAWTYVYNRPVMRLERIESGDFA